jgi:7-cyano-7-deazaguanine synthase
MKALLFSGGIDSTALAWALRPERLIFIDYGQVAAAGEARAVQSIAGQLGLRADMMRAPLSDFGHGIMVGGEPLNEEAPEFWPYRNQMLLTLAAMAYANLPLQSLLIGTVLGDDRHPDGRPQFIDGMNRLLAVQSGPRIEAPAASKSTEDVLEEYAVPLSILGWTFSCHSSEWACGHCHGCRKHMDVIRSVEARLG